MDTLMDAATPEAIAATAARLRCESVAFTYNDPVIFAEYAMDTADACHALGIKTVAVTAGYIGVAARREFYAKMDAANVKGFTDGFYVKLCGRICRSSTWFVSPRRTSGSRSTLIPGKNDSDAGHSDEPLDLPRAGCELRCTTAFHPDYQMTEIERAGGDTGTGAPHRARRACATCTGSMHDRAGGRRSVRTGKAVVGGGTRS
jgi:pyruvate formate lyase activating enzyme